MHHVAIPMLLFDYYIKEQPPRTLGIHMIIATTNSIEVERVTFLFYAPRAVYTHIETGFTDLKNVVNLWRNRCTT